MSVSATFPRFDARPLIAAGVALVGLVMFLPPLPAYAGEKSVFRDVKVESGTYAGEVSTVFGDARVNGLVAGDVHSAFGDVAVNESVGGSVNSGFGDIVVRAPVAGEVDAGFGDVYVHDVVKGGIDVDHGDIHLGNDAMVVGHVRPGSGEVHRAPGAEMRGPMGAGVMPDFGSSRDDDLIGYIGWFFAAAGFAACVVLAAVVARAPSPPPRGGPRRSPAGRCSLAWSPFPRSSSSPWRSPSPWSACPSSCSWRRPTWPSSSTAPWSPRSPWAERRCSPPAATGPVTPWPPPSVPSSLLPPP